MSTHSNHSSQHNDGKLPTSLPENASNPNPKDSSMEPANKNQLIDERGEKYLREVANPEDYPDEQDWEDAEGTLGASND